MPVFNFPFPASGEFLVKEGEEVSSEMVLAQGEVFSSFMRLPLASLLGVAVSDVTSYLKKDIGSKIEKMELLALKKGKFLRKAKKVFSPISGRLVSIDGVKGEAIIGSCATTFRLVSPGKGKVRKASSEEITIDFLGKEINLLDGAGPICWGELVSLAKKDEEVDHFLLDSSISGKILLGGVWGKISFSKAAAMGGRAILGIKIEKDFNKDAEKKFRFGEFIFKPEFSYGLLKEEDFSFVSLSAAGKIILDGGNKRLCLLK